MKADFVHSKSKHPQEQHESANKSAAGGHQKSADFAGMESCMGCMDANTGRLCNEETALTEWRKKHIQSSDNNEEEANTKS